MEVQPESENPGLGTCPCPLMANPLPGVTELQTREGLLSRWAHKRGPRSQAT